jgi:hypothetical protein
MFYNKANIGVVPIAAVITTAVKVLPGLIPFFRGAFQSPAGDARGVINAVKQQITSQDARTRLATVIAGSQQNFRAADVDVNEMLYWYRQNYPNDFMDLLPEDKLYWNSYLDNYRQKFLLQRPDLQQNYLDRSYFTKDQINYKKEAPGTQKAGSNMLVTLAIVGAGIFALSKMKK